MLLLLFCYIKLAIKEFCLKISFLLNFELKRVFFSIFQLLIFICKNSSLMEKNIKNGWSNGTTYDHEMILGNTFFCTKVTYSDLQRERGLEDLRNKIINNALSKLLSSLTLRIYFPIFPRKFLSKIVFKTQLLSYFFRLFLYFFIFFIFL